MAEDVIVPYDVKLNGLKYLILDNTYNEFPIRETVRPGSTPGGDREFRDNDNPAWAWWGQSNWEGEGSEDWEGDGAYYQGVGLTLEDGGRMSNASQFTTILADATNVDGYLIFTINNNTRLLMIDKTSGYSRYTDDGTTISTAVYVNGTAMGVTSYGYFRGSLIVGLNNGTLRTTNDNGVTWVAYPSLTPPNANPVYVLGAYRGKLHLSWGSILKTWDGTTLANPGASTVDVVLEGTPVVAAVGSGVMFLLCQGNPSRVFMMQGDQLSEMAQWTTDFQPDDAVFTDTLHIVGGGPDISGGQYGQRWTYTSLGIELAYDFPEVHGFGVDYRVRSLAARNGQLLFSYNKGYGFGTYDSTLDVYEQPYLGTALGSRTNSPAAGAARVIGIAYWKGLVFMGVSGVGLVKESGFCNVQVTSSLFGSSTKRVNKMWGTASLTFAELTTGQSITLEYSKNGGITWSLLGTASYDAANISKTQQSFDFPANYLTPVLQYRVTGYANNATMDILDISISFIEVAANPKRMWRFVIELYGDAEEPMFYRDDQPFERTSKQMKDELDLLWNKRFVFEDIFGKSYNVMMPAPHTKMSWVVRNSEDANPDSVTGVEAQYTVNLVQV